MATINLDKVIDVNYYPVYEAKVSNMKHRSVGVGIQGLADALVLLKIPFESDEAVEFNKKIMETIYLGALTASSDLAKERHYEMKEFIELLSFYPKKYDPNFVIYNDSINTLYHELKLDRDTIIKDNNKLSAFIKNCIADIYNIPEFYDKLLSFGNDRFNTLYHKLKPNKYELERTDDKYGTYSSYTGSLFSEGKFQFDMIDNITLHYPEKWDKLKEQVKLFGTRNSMLTALMPTASTSQILGNNECFEFFTNNIYTRKTQAGDFIMVNKYMVNDLNSIGLWTNNLKNNIIANDGSIQTIDNIPNDFKQLYKTMWEIKQSWVLKAAKARSPFVDQTQSMNIFMAEPDFQKLSSCHFTSWKYGLKTGMYYLRTKPSTGAIKFTIDPNLEKKVKNNNDQQTINSSTNNCESCSA
jgi:ribonucleotide reductase alpha subunit